MMTGKPAATEPDRTSIVLALLPLKLAVLIAFLVIGLALPVLPLHVHDGLGFGPVVVGVVAGCQFAASLIARIWSGHAADVRGAKWAVVAGLIGAAASGLLYLASLAFVTQPAASVSVLLVGRALLGAAESLIITGATAWGLARVGAANAGKVIAWMGTAMFAGFAAGAPLGSLLYASGGFAAVACVTSVAPLITLALLSPVRGSLPVRSVAEHRRSDRAHLAARLGCCAEQRRVRRHPGIRFPPLRPAWMEAGLAGLLGLCGRPYRRPAPVRPPPGPPWRSQGRSWLRRR
ncbi:MFS transporter [Micromonospora sp. STR1s_5]|nr:MFS transporter [Micromonospora sp. STR1s_5]